MRVRILRDVVVLGETPSLCATTRSEMERCVLAGRMLVRAERLVDLRRAERQYRPLPSRMLLPRQLSRLQRAAADPGAQRTATVD